MLEGFNDLVTPPISHAGDLLTSQQKEGKAVDPFDLLEQNYSFSADGEELYQ